MEPTLRSRNEKIAPVNGYSFKIGKKVENLSAVKKKTIDKKKKKRVKIIDDTLLDMLRLFTRRELCAFQLVNRRMKRVVELGDQKKQLRQRLVLPRISFSSCTSHNSISAAAIRANTWMDRNCNKNVSDDDEQHLQNILAKNLTLLTETERWEMVKDFYITIFLTGAGGYERAAYVMELKTHPKTVKYLRRIRFWLRELSRVHFTSATIAGAPFLNPTLVDALFPNEDIFLSLGDVEIHSHLDCMLPGIAALTRIGVLNCDPHHLTDGIKTLFNELLLKSKHGVGKLEFSYSIVNMTMIDIIKIIDEFEYAKLKRLPSEMQFCHMYESLKNHPSLPLKHIETTDKAEKYELVRKSAGCMKIFLVRTRDRPRGRLTVQLIDQGR